MISGGTRVHKALPAASAAAVAAAAPACTKPVAAPAEWKDQRRRSVQRIESWRRCVLHGEGELALALSRW